MSDQSHHRDAVVDLATCEIMPPGPWRIVKDRDGDITIIDGRERIVAHLACRDADDVATAIAETREALPWWIRTAMEKHRAALASEFAALSIHAENVRLQKFAFAEAVERHTRMILDSLRFAGIVPTCDWEDCLVEQTVVMEVTAIQREAQRLREENARLQSIADALPGLVEAQAEAARRRRGLARLEAWSDASPGNRWFSIRRLWVDVQSVFGRACVAFRCPCEYADYHSDYKECNVVVVGTDERPATLDEMIEAALARWEEVYGDK